jgi:sodium transport system ATP-binding protein
VIEVKNLKKSFGKVQAVESVSFSAENGKITGLLGPNGAGKTTALRMLYTLLQPEEGQVLIDQVDVARDPSAARRRLGVLPDSRGLYKRLTSRENIAYFGELQGLRGSALTQAVDTMIQQLGISDIADRRTEGFSQGQRVKVGIARALVHQPQNVVLDEPTNGLDVMSTRAMRQFIFKLRDEGRCVLFSSHIMQEVAALCDHIVIIARGRVVAQGSTDQLKAIAGLENLEDAFVRIIGTDEGLNA